MKYGTSSGDRRAGRARGASSHPAFSDPPLQTARPQRSSGAGRWLTTLAADLSTVRDATLAALSDMGADLAYLYHAEDRAVVRALLRDYAIRVEIAPVAAHDTRIVVVATRDGEVDRSMSGRIVRDVEQRLELAAVP